MTITLANDSKHIWLIGGIEACKIDKKKITPFPLNGLKW